jgi:hypothetical protein
VAVVVRSKGGGGGSYWVFDPILNLEQGVLSLDDWKKRLGPNLGRVHLRAAESYRLLCDKQPNCDLDNPCFESAIDEGEQREELLMARCSLACLSAIEGDPPFQC